MTGEEFTRKKRLLQALEALGHSPAYAELHAAFMRHKENAMDGLRDRNSPREKRDEYLQAAEDAEELLSFVDNRIKGLELELRVPPEGVDQED